MAKAKKGVSIKPVKPKNLLKPTDHLARNPGEMNEWTGFWTVFVQATRILGQMKRGRILGGLFSHSVEAVAGVS